jgi:transposase-like protein
MGKSKRHFSSRVKFKIVMEVLTGERTPAQIAKAYGVHPNSIGYWKKTFMERGPEIFESGGGSERERRIADLEQLLGKKEVEIALLKNFLGRGE